MKMETYKRWVGKRFGKLTVISLNDYRDGVYVWHCACDCGNTRLAYRTYLLQSPNPSCGCAQKDPRAGLREVIRRYKRQAKERNFEWKLTEDEVFSIILQKCVYCGEPPSNTDSGSKQKYNGIDRLDSKKGYYKGNCYACCIRCNRAKSDMTLAQFETWLVQAYEHLIMDRS